MLNLRGLQGADRTLVMLDGLPIHNGLNGSANLNLLPTARLRRVEIVRGPFSALYGSRAMGGVIHVLTQPGGVNPGITLRAGLGLHGARVIAPTAAFAAGPVEASVVYQRHATDDYLGTGIGNLDYAHHRLHLRVDLYRRRTLSAELTGGLYHSRMGFNQDVDLRDEPLLGFYLRNRGRSAKHNGYGRLAVRYKPLKKLELQVVGSGLYQRQQFWSQAELLEGELPASFPLEVQEDTYNAWQWRLEFLGRWRALSWLHLVGGYEQVWDRGDWFVRRKEDQDLIAGMKAHVFNAAGFLQTDLSFLEGRLNAIVGFRVDRHPDFGWAVSPKAGLSARVAKQTVIRASGGRAFRAPTLTELYAPPWQRIPPYLTVGNPDLDAETVWSADLGVEQSFGRRFRGRVTGFYNEGENLIGLRVGGDGYERYLNTDRIRAAGVEVELRARPWRWLALRASYTYTYSRDLGEDVVLDYTPEHSAGLVITGQHAWSWGWFSAAADVRLQSPRWYHSPRDPDSRVRTPTHAVGNLRIQLGWERVTWYVDLTNLWNARYEQTESIPAPRFQLMAGLRLDVGWPKKRGQAGPPAPRSHRLQPAVSEPSDRPPERGRHPVVVAGGEQTATSP